jgi:hypothetical protein
MFAPGIPRVGDKYVGANGETDIGCYCYSVQPRSLDEPRWWEVTCTYSNDGAKFGDAAKEQSDKGNKDSDKENNPTSRPPRVTTTWERYVFPAVVDVNGKPIVNSAGEPFDPPNEVEDLRPVISVTVVKEKFNPADALPFAGAVNDDNFLGIPPGLARLAGLSATTIQEGGRTLQEVTYEFHVNFLGWELKVLDVGFRQKKDDGTLVEIEVKGDTTGRVRKLSSPWPLDGKGKAQAAGNAPVVLSFQVYPKKGFGGLGLPAGLGQ